ncbi:MAG: DUF169 domain-containing protein [Candidatus Lokiarchaeia archaeon]
MESWMHIGKSLEELLRPHTYPLAVKLVKNESEFPEKTRRPEQKIAVCQGFTISRRYGWTMGITEEDSGCPAASLNYGWKKIADESMMHQFFLGAGYVSNETAAKTLLENMDRLKPGEYSGVVISPLARTKIAPDVILVYGNPAQIMRLIQGVMYKEGKRLKTELLGLAASCTGGVIRAFNTGECQLAIPGTGDRAFALTYDNEMLFAIPAAKAEEIITGMKGQRLVKYPVPTPLLMPPPFPGL